MCRKDSSLRTPTETIEISFFGVRPGAVISARGGCRRSLESSLEHLRPCTLAVEQKHTEDTNRAGKHRPAQFANGALESERTATLLSTAWFESRRQHDPPDTRLGAS